MMGRYEGFAEPNRDADGAAMRALVREAVCFGSTTVNEPIHYGVQTEDSQMSEMYRRGIRWNRDERKTEFLLKTRRNMKLK
ncbi:hypothetical protein CEXT_143411 [Caerostris extrusa]|uniref:Uncharacterized protein n=1 Tax=Caerostris extrusa TaxID=172846 RepID=A0AAV4XNL6_CAEEX|nr:hypothetical protein CEXT_143411 [Caerostris extrusa]